jgi:hypothetical protein
MSRRWFIESSTKLQLSLIDQLEFNACSLQKVHKLVVMMLACELLLELLMFLLSETSQRCPWNVWKHTKHIEYECPSRNFGWEWDILVRGHSSLAWIMKEIHQNDMRLQTWQMKQWITTGMATWIDEANNGMLETTWRWHGDRMMGTIRNGGNNDGIIWNGDNKWW